MKKSLFKSILRDIKGSMSRFVSIFGIVAIGISFFTGLRVTAPDMRRSADQYFDDQRLMDFRIVSTIGFDEEDIARISSMENVVVYPTYFSDMIVEADENESVARILSLPGTVVEDMPLNIIEINEGRFPQNENECLINADELEGSIPIGTEIRIKSADSRKGGDVSDVLKNDTYVIVGTYFSPIYIDRSTRGNTSIGNGVINSVIYIPESNFISDYYTEVYIGFEELNDLQCYDDQYIDRVKELEVELGIIGDGCRTDRFFDILAEANEKIAEALEELESGKIEAEKELGDAWKELEEAYLKLKDARIELDDGERELKDAEGTIRESERELQEARASYGLAYADFIERIRSGEEELNKNRVKLDDAEAEYEKGVLLYEDGLAQFLFAKEQYEDGVLEYDTAVAELKMNEEEYIKGKSVFEDAYGRYLAGVSEIEQASLQLIELETSVNKTMDAYGENTPEYLHIKSIYDEAESEYIASKLVLEQTGLLLTEEKEKLDAAQEQIEAGKLELSIVKEELDYGKEELIQNQVVLEAAQSELDDVKAEIASGRTQLSQGTEELRIGQIEGERELADALAFIIDGEDAIEDGKREIEERWEDYREGFQAYEDGVADYLSGVLKYEEAEIEAEEKIAEGEREINKAKQELGELEDPKWYIFDRTNNPGYLEYSENAERIRKISQVFPIFFILVAALVCFTTMQRMVEENRLEIGTLKALGYGNRSIVLKYMIYALVPTILGAIGGFLFGMKLFPYVIISAYGIMYSMNAMELPYDFLIAGVAILVAAVAVSATVISACYSELKGQPSQLMRPKAPKNGKRVFLERITFVWKRLSFSRKVSLRNIFRYKKRMFMTVIGISGCTALLLTGFALFDCIGDIADKQYGELMTYTGFLAVDSNMAKQEEKELQSILKQYNSGYIKMHQKQYDVRNENKSISAYVCVPYEPKANDDTGSMLFLDDVIALHDRKSKEPFSIDDGVIITEKAASLLKLRSGDEIEITLTETKKRQLKVNSIAENYAYHYIYMSEEEFIHTFGEKPDYTMLYFKNELSDEENNRLAYELLEQDFVLTVQFNTKIQDSFRDMLKSLDLVIAVIIISAAGLAFVVLYNLTNINITERIREIATLKVLGFYDVEVDQYIFRENLMLAFIGDVVGLVLGVFLARYVILTAEVDMAMFGREIHLRSYVLAAVITLVFAAVVTFSMHFKLIKVDMAQSLKSVE